MNRKDIALTVAGTIATMALAYLFYRQEQAKQAAPVVQDVTDPNSYTGTDDALYAASYASQLPSISVPSLSSAVDTSSSTAATGSEASTNGENLLAQILAQFHTDNAPSSGADFSSLAIPVIDTQPVVSTSGIPTTAADALTNAQNMLGTGSNLTDTDNHAVPAPSSQAPSVSSSGAIMAVPYHFNHIVPSEVQV
jgi:hypothetical protein